MMDSETLRLLLQACLLHDDDFEEWDKYGIHPTLQLAGKNLHEFLKEQKLELSPIFQELNVKEEKI